MGGEGDRALKGRTLGGELEGEGERYNIRGRDVPLGPPRYRGTV